MSDGFVERAQATGSDAVVVCKAGERVIDWVGSDGHRPIETMSVTKMVVGIAVAASMCSDGPDVLDEPVTAWLPEWKDDDRAAITLRRLLNHHSGLQVVPPPEIATIPDAYAAALDLPLTQPPGEAFIYNNLAFNLVGSIVKRATGSSIVEVAEGVLFGSRSFGRWHWKTDLAGDPWCHFGLVCRADDLARVGRLLLDGQGIIPEWWLEQATDSGMSCYPQSAWIRASFSPRLIDTWTKAGVDQSLILKLGDLIDREMDFDDLWGEFEARLGDDTYVLMNQVISRGLQRFSGSSGPTIAYGHDGDGGQYLLVMPDRDAVAVRLRESLDKGGLWSSFPGDAYEVAA